MIRAEGRAKSGKAGKLDRNLVRSKEKVLGFGVHRSLAPGSLPSIHPASWAGPVGHAMPRELSVRDMNHPVDKIWGFWSKIKRSQWLSGVQEQQL